MAFSCDPSDIEGLKEHITRRYGDAGRVAWADASPQFAITAASAEGDASLPEELLRLLERVTTNPRARADSAERRVTDSDLHPLGEKS